MESLVSTLTNIIGGIFNAILKFVLITATPVFIYSCYVFVFIILGTLYYRLYRRVPKIKPLSVYKKKSKFKRLFFDFPKRFLIDLVHRDPNRFTKNGLYMFVGRQGSGKSISVVHYLMMMKQVYPKIVIRTNMNYKYQNSKLKDWKDLVLSNNGEYGQIEVLDEIQTWFSSKDSGYMPPQMLANICQQRKQSKALLGTAQRYNRIAKEIREQVDFVYCPITLFGCLTIVRITRPDYYDDEKQKFKKYLWLKTYFFVHDDKIRNAYDTYEIVEGLAKSGFKKPSETIFNNNDLHSSN